MFRKKALIESNSVENQTISHGVVITFFSNVIQVRLVRSHERRLRENTSHKSTLCSLEFLQKSELNYHVRKQHMGEGTSAAQPKNNSGAHLFSEPQLTPSNRKKPDELIFGGTFSQLSGGRIAALISEEHRAALKNMCMRFFFGNLNFHANC